MTGRPAFPLLTSGHPSFVGGVERRNARRRVVRNAPQSRGKDMTTGHAFPIPRPLALAVALVAALAATVLATGPTRAAVWSLTADLTAEAEVPNPGPPGATGSALIVIDDETNEVCFELAIDGLPQGDTVLMAHIHTGAAGVAGGVVVPLFTEPPTAEMTGCVQGVDPATIAAITADPAGHYVNIHSEQYPEGAVRGQLVVASTGGECNITVEPSTIADGGQFTVTGDFGAGAEIHVVPGESGSVPEDAEPILTISDDRTSFSVTITMLPGSVGSWTVWAFIFGTECGDSAPLTVTAALPNTAAPITPLPLAPLAQLAGALLLVGAAWSVGRRRRTPTR
jgi:hypothetical protein